VGVILGNRLDMLDKLEDRVEFEEPRQIYTSHNNNNNL